jgi:hypothetical protein
VNERESGDKSEENSIGRPGEWQEGRYERPGDGNQESVVRKPGKDFEPDATVSTPVTQEDYTGIKGKDVSDPGSGHNTGD